MVLSTTSREFLTEISLTDVYKINFAAKICFLQNKSVFLQRIFINTLIMDELKTKQEDFIKRFRASQQRKKERLAILEKVLRDEYKLRTGREATKFCAL